MGMFARLFPRRRPETRYVDGWQAAALGGEAHVHSRVAESLGTVAACVSLLSSTIASLPASLTMDGPDGRTPAPSTAPAWRLLARPNPHQSWPAYVAQVAAGLLLDGNAVSMVTADGRGALTGLQPIPWGWLLPTLLQGSAGAPRLAFDVIPVNNAEAKLLNLPPRLLADEVLHVRARSDVGIIGRSVLQRAGAPVREGLAIAELAQANWRNGVRPSGILSAPGYLSQTQRDRFGLSWLRDFAGSLNAGSVPLLEGGWTFQGVRFSSVDAEFLESRQFSVDDVCRLFNVPSVLLQLGSRVPPDISPYVTAYAQLAVTPLVNTIEAEFDNLLPSGQHLAIDVSGLMRGSFGVQVAAMCALVQSGIATPNDARRSLNMPAMEGGDQLRVGAAPAWPADAHGLPHLGLSPGKTGDGLAQPGTNQDDGAG